MTRLRFSAFIILMIAIPPQAVHVLIYLQSDLFSEFRRSINIYFILMKKDI